MSKPSDYFDRGNFVPMRLVDEVLADTVDNYLVTPITERGGDTIWHYHSNLGIFKPDGVAYVEDQAKKALGPKAKPAHIAEVLKLAMIGTYTDPALFVEDPDVIVVENGVYHLDTGELTPHSSVHHAKAALPVKYDPDAKCPTIMRFLEEVIPDAVPTFQEWLGYHLYKDMIFHKAAMFIGDGANGKTTLQDLMSAFLGRENVSQVNLYNLISNRFATSELYLKLANISPEIASDDLKRTGTFKALTGHDRIRAEKKYRDAFSFTNYAKLTFLCNTLPHTPDKTRAFFRRWLLFVFPNKFEGTDCDEHILKKLTTPEELSGLFNWALEGLHQLLENGKFTENLTADEIQAKYEEMSDPITAFIQEHIIISPDGVVSKDDLYQAYYQFCRDKGWTAVLKGTFTSELKPRIAGIGESLRKIRGKKMRCWLGIRLMEDTQTILDTMSSTDSQEGLEEKTDTRDTRETPFSVDSKLECVEDDNKGVSLVSPVSAESLEVSENPLDRDDKLFVDAVRVLRGHGGQMRQQDLLRVLVGLGHRLVVADPALRGDDRFVFMGLYVKLSHTNREGAPP